jgi:uncharacterized small protein (DUF1192 family)
MIQTQVHQRARIRTDLQHACAAREAALERHDLPSLVDLAARIDALLDEMARLRAARH